MFFSLQQSAFLHALGNAIGNSLWQVAALWLLFAAISGLIKMNAANRYRLAVGFSTAGFLWFLYSLVTKYIATASSPVEFWDSYQNTGTSIFTSGFSSNISFVYHSFLASLSSLSPYISCAYLLVWLLLATRLVNGFRQVRQFGTQGLGKVHIDIKLFVQQHAALLEISKKVRIFTSAYVQSPLTIGFFKPLILLPVASLSHLSPAQLEAILLHELAHIKRHDYLVNIFVQVAEITLFFNPFMRLLLKQIKQERENCCDDYVLQFQYNAADYAKALLGIAQNRTATLLAMGAKTNQFQLLNRVKRMVAPQPQTFNYRQQLYMLCLITLLGLGITMIAPNSTAQAKKTMAETKTIIQQPTAAAPAAIPAAEEEIPAEPPAPKAFDFVKSVANIVHLAKDMDTEGIQKEGEEMAGHSKEIEQQTKAITESALKDVQPIVENAQAFSKKLAENLATLKFQKLPEDADVNDYIASFVDKVNDAAKEFSSIIVSPRAVARPVIPAPPAVREKIKIVRQLALERKVLLTQSQVDEQQADARKSMDSLQAALNELGASKRQTALCKIQAKLAAIKTNENWDVAFNEENGNINKTTKHFATIYTNKMGTMIRKLVADMSTDIDIKDLNDIQVQIKSEMDKLQSEKINIQFIDRHQEKTHHKNNDCNSNNVIIIDGADLGS